MLLAIACIIVGFWITTASDASTVVPFYGSGASRDEGSPGLLGWIVAMMLGIALLWRFVADRFEVRGKSKTRNMMVQGPVTYKVSFSTPRRKPEPLPRAAGGRVWRMADTPVVSIGGDALAAKIKRAVA